MWCSFGDRRSLLVLIKKCNEHAVSGSSSKDGQGESGFGGCYWNPWLRELIVYFVPPFFAETFGWQSRLFDGQKPGKNSTGASATTKTINELRHILQPGFLFLQPEMMCSLTKTGDAKTHMEEDLDVVQCVTTVVPWKHMKYLRNQSLRLPSCSVATCCWTYLYTNTYSVFSLNSCSDLLLIHLSTKGFVNLITLVTQARIHPRDCPKWYFWYVPYCLWYMEPHAGIRMLTMMSSSLSKTSP